jgi:hypothetical protein
MVVLGKMHGYMRMYWVGSAMQAHGPCKRKHMGSALQA